MWFLVGRMPYLLSEVGSRPASRPTFFCKKVGKEPPPAAHVPFAALRGNLRRQPPVAVRQNSLRAFSAPFKQVAADLKLKRLHSAVQPHAPRGCHHRRGQKGQYRMRDSFFLLLIAACVC